jgi:serine/threonine-protein kinase
VEEVIAGRYRLEAPLGAGGMATVVSARDLRLERPVAVKLMPVAGIDAAGRARFVREARSSAGFSHPNAVAVYDAGEAGGYLYLVMEIVDGPSLASRLAEHGRLGGDEAVAVTTAVLAALGAAHAAGIVHRDVKPGNILLGRTGVKLADFGIAKRLGDADLTGAGQFVGTPKYLAPEQAMGEPATPASDLYSAGVVLYEMLAGRPPYLGDTPVATAIAHRDAPIPDIRRVRPDVPDHVARVVRTAMAKDPRRRFASAGAMAAELTNPRPRATSSERTQVMPATTRRSRRWVWAAAAAGLAAGGAGALVLADRDEPHGAEAETPPDATAAPATTVTPTTAAPATTVTPTTAAPATTAVPTTVTPTTTAPPPVTAPPVPDTIEELIALVEADPGRFGARAPDVVQMLDGIEQAHGHRESDRAGELLQWIEYWVFYGELSDEAVSIVVPVVEPIADAPGKDRPGGEDDDDD